MKTITLKPNGIGRYDDVSPFIIADKNLQLKIKLPAVNGDFYLVAENNGMTVKTVIPRDGTVTLNNPSAGELRAEVRHYFKGELIKSYKIEPLILKEIDGALSAEPEIVAMSREMSELKKILGEERESAEEREKIYQRVVEAYDAQFKKLKANLFALVLFAYVDYRKNVYLGGEGVETFCEEFGLELTDEQKKILEELEI